MVETTVIPISIMTYDHVLRGDMEGCHDVDDTCQAADCSELDRTHIVLQLLVASLGIFLSILWHTDHLWNCNSVEVTESLETCQYSPA